MDNLVFILSFVAVVVAALCGMAYALLMRYFHIWPWMLSALVVLNVLLRMES